jgi:carboxyl-terminal processing protease
MRFLSRVSLVLAFLAVAVSSSAFAQQPGRSRSTEEYDRILNIIENQALDSVDMYWCSQQIQKRGISACLDKYSGYFTGKEIKELIPTNFVGIGARLVGEGETVIVLYPIAGSPADKAGILQGDTLVKIDSVELSFKNPVTAEDMQAVIAKVRGSENTPVKLWFLRAGKVVGPLTVVRATITINPVSFARLSPTVGYVRLTEFNQNAAENMDRALEGLKKAGIKKIVLDLRGNPGGYLNQAEAVADLFSPDSGNVKITQRFRGAPDRQSITPARGPYADMKMVVLVDSGSASAAEMVAGIFQDWKAATLVGTHTFGKGIGQSIIPLFRSDPDTPFLKLTTFAFLVGNHQVKITPTAPIQPDSAVGNDLTDAEKKQLKAELRTHNPNLPYLNPKLDKQLAAAIALLK